MQLDKQLPPITSMLVKEFEEHPVYQHFVATISGMYAMTQKDLENPTLDYPRTQLLRGELLGYRRVLDYIKTQKQELEGQERFQAHKQTQQGEV